MMTKELEQIKDAMFNGTDDERKEAFVKLWQSADDYPPELQTELDALLLEFVDKLADKVADFLD